MQVVVLYIYMLSISRNRSIWAIFYDRERQNELLKSFYILINDLFLV